MLSLFLPSLLTLVFQPQDLGRQLFRRPFCRNPCRQPCGQKRKQDRGQDRRKSEGYDNIRGISSQIVGGIDQVKQLKNQKSSGKKTERERYGG